MCSKIFPLFLLCCCLVSLRLSGQTDSTASPDSSQGRDSLAMFYEMPMEELKTLKAKGVSTEMEQMLNCLIAAASHKALNTRESPNIVSVITHEQIRKSGARDLIDVLRMVPGFDFAQDMFGNVGLGIRGNWANEGKVLLMLDGQEMNSVFASNLTFGNHFPVENIRQIEVIRGPGSAVHGGSAAMGVINIKTFSGEEIDGAQLSSTFGRMDQTTGRWTGNLMLGDTLRGWDLSLNLFGGMGHRSGQRIKAVHTPWKKPVRSLDSLVEERPMAGNSDLNPLMLNIGASKGNFNFRYIYDRYQLADVTSLVAPGEQTLEFTTNSHYGEVSYDWQLSPAWSLEPKLNVVAQLPSFPENTEKPRKDPGQIFVQRLNPSVLAHFKPHHQLDLSFGSEYFVDAVGALNDEDSITYLNRGGFFQSLGQPRFLPHTDSIAFLETSSFNNRFFHNFAVFGQLYYDNYLANLILGYRYDASNLYGDAHVPRIGLTKQVGSWSLKALYSRAFRAPAVMNVAAGARFTNDTAFVNDIEPEKTNVLEGEVGYQINRRMYVSLNGYAIWIEDPIIRYNPSSELPVYRTLYRNFPRAGTRGLELDYKWVMNGGHLFANYSYYSIKNHPAPFVYQARQPELGTDITDERLLRNDRQALGFPTHKINIGGSYDFTEDFSLTATLNLKSQRYGHDIQGRDSAGVTLPEPHLQQFGPVALLNLSAEYRNLLVEGLDLQVSLFDVFNQQFQFVQPYLGYNAPLPGPSRELTFRLRYRLPDVWSDKAQRP